MIEKQATLNLDVISLAISFVKYLLDSEAYMHDTIKSFANETGKLIEVSSTDSRSGPTLNPTLFVLLSAVTTTDLYKGIRSDKHTHSNETRSTTSGTERGFGGVEAVFNCSG